MLLNGYSFLAECLKILIVMTGILSYKIKNKYVFCYSVIGIFIVFGLASIFGFHLGFDNTYLNGTISMLIIILNLQGKHKIPVVFISYMVICILDMIIAALFMFSLGISVKSILSNELLKWLCNILSIIICLIISLITRHFVKSIKGNSLISLRFMFLIIICIISLGLYLAPLQILDFKDGQINLVSAVAFAATLSGLVFIYISVMLIIQTNEKVNLEKTNLLNDRMLKCQEKYYQAVLAKNTETSQFRHDISNHLYCMYILCKNREFDELENYISSITGRFRELKMDIQSGNDLVNAIAKEIISEYEGVTIEWKGLLPKNLKISNMDLCTIFSNIIMNASYAVSKVEEDKTIKVRVNYMNTSLSVLIENAVVKDVEINGNTIISDKNDKVNHGIGTKNIERCIKMYGGSIKYTCENKVFTSELILPNVIGS